MGDPVLAGEGLKVHAVWGCVVIIVVLLFTDGTVATTAAGVVIAGLASLAGFTIGKST